MTIKYNSETQSTPQHMNSVYTVPSGLYPPPSTFNGTNLEIFVGDGYSAEDVVQLSDYQIQGILNVAYDLDDQPQSDEYTQQLKFDSQRPAPPQSDSLPPLQRYQQQFAKVGLIDGYGNTPNHMSVIAAVYMADQLFTFGDNATICPPLVNDYNRGNLLIHCWSGHSRSVTVAALYIWYKFGVQLRDPNLSSFTDVYNSVKTARSLSIKPIADQHPQPACVPNVTTGMTENPPTCGMQNAALEITSTYSSLFPKITTR